MNYIYDILLNFNEKLYDFYEWDLNDDIIHVRKIPLFYVTSEVMEDLKQNQVKFEEKFCHFIFEKTEVFTNKNVNFLGHASLFSDRKEVLGLLIGKDGKSMKRTRLLVDEENEALEVSERLNLHDLKVEVVSPVEVLCLQTRRQLRVESGIKKEIVKLKNNNLEKLKYLYYDCFDEKEENIDKIMHRFSQVILHHEIQAIEKIEEFLKLTRVHK